MNKLTTEEFIDRAIKVHGDRYDYSLVIYIDSNTKVKIFCKKCKQFFYQLPHNHLKYDCYLCSNDNKNIINKGTKDELLKQGNEIHGNKFDYSRVVYIDNNTKVEIGCNVCGDIFYQIPKNHINKKYGCPKCSCNKKLTTNEFIEKSKEIFGNKIDYSKTEYKTTKDKIKLICVIHGEFEKTPNNHLCKKQGCPICKESKGEMTISSLLYKNNIIYERQKKFDDCKNKNKLPFDFYLQDYNLCIEFDGEQHFRENKSWGKESFDRTLRHDKIKNKFCEDNNIKLIRIKYDENIEEKLKDIWVKN